MNRSEEEVLDPDLYKKKNVQWAYIPETQFDKENIKEGSPHGLFTFPDTIHEIHSELLTKHFRNSNFATVTVYLSSGEDLKNVSI